MSSRHLVYVQLRMLAHVCGISCFCKGKDTIPFLIWCYSIKHTLPKMFIQECTPRFDLSMQRSILSGLYDIMARRICPAQLGSGNRRPRQWSVGLLRGHVKANFRFDGPEFAELLCG